MYLVVQSLSCVLLFVTLWTAAHQAFLSFTLSRSLVKLMFIESVRPSNHLILCHPLLLLPSIFPSNRAFSSELAFQIRWPKYWSFSVSISPSNEYSGLGPLAGSSVKRQMICMLFPGTKKTQLSRKKRGLGFGAKRLAAEVREASSRLGPHPPRMQAWTNHLVSQ